MMKKRTMRRMRRMAFLFLFYGFFPFMFELIFPWSWPGTWSLLIAFFFLWIRLLNDHLRRFINSLLRLRIHWMLFWEVDLIFLSLDVLLFFCIPFVAFIHRVRLIRLFVILFVFLWCYNRGFVIRWRSLRGVNFLVCLMVAWNVRFLNRRKGVYTFLLHFRLL